MTPAFAFTLSAFTYNIYLRKWRKQINRSSLDLHTAISFSNQWFFSENSSAFYREKSIDLKLFYRNYSFRFLVVLLQYSKKVQVSTTGSCRIFEVFDYCLPDIGWKNRLFKERAHHLLEIVFPFLSVGFCFSFMFIPGKKMSKLMNSSDQKGVRIQVIVNRDTMSGIFKWMTIVAMFGTPISWDLEFTIEIIYPTRDDGCCIRWQVITQDIDLIQFTSEDCTL